MRSDKSSKLSNATPERHIWVFSLHLAFILCFLCHTLRQVWAKAIVAMLQRNQPWLSGGNEWSSPSPCSVHPSSHLPTSSPCWLRGSLIMSSTSCFPPDRHGFRIITILGRYELCHLNINKRLLKASAETTAASLGGHTPRHHWRENMFNLGELTL